MQSLLFVTAQLTLKARITETEKLYQKIERECAFMKLAIESQGKLMEGE